MSLKTRDFGIEIKELSDEGTFTGYGSVFGNVDSYGDKIVPGAFGQTLAKHRREGSKVPMLWQHMSEEPIGVWTDLVEDGKGLRAHGQLILGVPRAASTYQLMKQSAIRGLSIGYTVNEADTDGNVRLLKEVELWEISVVTFPANRRATVDSVKSNRFEEFARLLRDGEPPPIKEFEDLLREAGVPKSMAVRIASVGYAKAIRSESDGKAREEVSRALKGLRDTINELKS